MSELERRYHETWLGMVQPVDGLVFSVPVLVDAGVMERTSTDAQDRFLAHLVERGGRPCIADLMALLRDIAGFGAADFDDGEETRRALSHFVPEGGQTLAPTWVLRTQSASPDASPAARAEVLVWQVPDGLDLDRAETRTGPWAYPPQAKLDRLLRAVRVPVGLLVNGECLRLVYAPHGESTGALTFRVEDMASVGGRPILDAFLSLLSARRFFVVPEDRTLRALLVESRKRQANVTNTLAEQVFEALDILLHGFEAAAERDATSALREAMQAEGEPGEHVYGGLLTSMLRLVFLLYAEDRGLMPMDRAVYAQHLSVLGLFDQLQQDAGLFPDTMARRFGAWPRLLALFRAVYEGVASDALSMPARRGRLFDPNAYPFLEGWTHGGAAPHDVESRSQVSVPSVDDETVYRVLDRLLLLDGQRLSYRALDVEQIGSVYEALMGYRVQRLGSQAACLRDSGVWLEAERLLAEAPNRREALVVEVSTLPKARVAKVADALKAAQSEAEGIAALEALRKHPKRLPLRPAGALVLQPGPERRRTSSHYTPRSLSAPIVEKTLRPLLATMAASPRGITADRLLELKICDPAMGSGAFLVEACRFLADEVIKAWTAEGTLPEIERQHGEPVVYARRLVAQQCLYGVDKNPYAVNLAKLSLWLVSLAKDEPFTFVDHSLRWGDSLVGLSVEQLRRFHWKDTGPQADWLVDVVTKDLEESLENRQRILALAREHGSGATREKERLLRDAEDAAANARLLADVLVGAFFAKEKDKEREKERERRLLAAQAWVVSGKGPTLELLTWQQQMHAVTPPFHWAIEFPEVFYAGRPDPLDAEVVNQVAWMDAFVGNPPFMGGSIVSASMGFSYIEWLLLRPATHGNSDYCVFFLRRMWELLGDHGTLGVIATNTVAQGDSRASGLQPVLSDGAQIFAATRSMRWPGLAAVAVSIVHLAKGTVVGREGKLMLDGMAVADINSRLRPKPERADPVSLAANRRLVFQGSNIHGLGFVLSPAERRALVERNPSNAERIFPFIGGQELNTSPTQSADAFVINFEKMSLPEAEAWPDLMAIVREKVKPERDKLRAGQVSAEHARKHWWQFYATRSESYPRIRCLRRCLVASQISKHLVFAWQDPHQVFAHVTNVFAVSRDSQFGVLQSRVHERWAALLTSTMGDSGLRYSPSDCFETFPFPSCTEMAEASWLAAFAATLNARRARFMLDTQQGLTATYNLLKNPTCQDPRILELRRLHEAMDRAVLEAYGWTDIAVPPYCPLNDKDRKAVETFEDEVIDRLFALNAERAKEEALLGQADAAKKAAGAKQKSKKKNTVPEEQPKLL